MFGSSMTERLLRSVPRTDSVSLPNREYHGQGSCRFEPIGLLGAASRGDDGVEIADGNAVPLANTELVDCQRRPDARLVGTDSMEDRLHPKEGMIPSVTVGGGGPKTTVRSLGRLDTSL